MALHCVWRWQFISLKPIHMYLRAALHALNHSEYPGEMGALMIDVQYYQKQCRVQVGGASMIY